MADKNDGGDKTEQPTPKKLLDARKKGNVWKSKDVTSTVELVAWLALGGLGTAFAGLRLQSLMAASLQGMDQGFVVAARNLGWHCAEIVLLLTALFTLPVVAVGVLAEFLQAGPVLAFDKVKPKVENLNPVEGVKRMFSMDNLVEVLKSIAKTVLLLAIGALVLRAALPQIVLTVRQAAPGAGGVLGDGHWALTVPLLAWTIGSFALLSLLDAVWQRHAFIKKMRMSRRDLKQEMKESEGDPYVRQQRKQVHQEWSQNNAAQAARQASAVVVNPTHVAIALEHDPQRCPIPTIAAKGEDELARVMREAAEEAGVPIVRNVELARELLARAEVGEIVPPHLFEIVAEVIVWAREVREQIDRQRRGQPPAARRAHVPGVDATRYPETE